MGHYFTAPLGRALTVAETDELAEAYHRGQMYGDEPYVNHVRRVAARLAGNGEWVYTAGLLHDIVEDTEMTIEGLRLLNYPEIVVQAVDSVTVRDGEEYFDRIRIAAAHPLGCHVKLADNRDNACRLPALAATDPKRAARLGDKYERAQQILLPALMAHRRASPGAIFGPEMPSTDSWNGE